MAVHDPGIVPLHFREQSEIDGAERGGVEVSSRAVDRRLRPFPTAPPAGEVAPAEREPDLPGLFDGKLGGDIAGGDTVTSGLLMQGKRGPGEPTTWMALNAVAAWFSLHPSKLAPLDIETIERMAGRLEGRRLGACGDRTGSN